VINRVWRGDTGRALDYISITDRFNARPFRCPAATLDQVVHAHDPLFTKQCKLIPAKGGDILKLGR